VSRFDGKHIVITGGTSGLGEATVLAFAAEGADVWFCGLVDSEGARVCETAAGLEGSATYMFADVRDPSSVKAFIKSAHDAMGGIDVAVNNAGISHDSHKMADIPLDDVDNVWRTNVMGTWHAMRSELSIMVKQQSGIVVNVASILSRSGAGWVAAYGMSKHAVVGITKSAAMDYASDGIRINAISPGPIKTPMLARAMEDIGDDLSKFAGGLPEGGPANPEDIAKSILYLASEDANYMNGANLVLDGGTSTGVRQ